MAAYSWRPEQPFAGACLMAKPSIKSKIRSYLKAKERGKAEYERADRILDELIAGLKPGLEVSFDTSGRKAKLIDNFENGNTAFRAHGIKRFEIKVI